MKFSAKVSDIIQGLQPTLVCANTGVKREYPDAGRITLDPQPDGLRSYTNNGNVAIINTNSAGSSYGFDEAGSVSVKANDFQSVLSSFNDKEFVDVALEGNEVVLRPRSDPEKFQTVPSEPREIAMPQLAQKFDKTVTIKRDVFLNAMKKVVFAIGYEKFRPEFLYWVLRVSPGKVRAVCGDGARFAVYQIEGENVIDAKKQLDIVIHREHNPVLEKVLPSVDGDSVIVKEYARGNDDDSLMNQTVLEMSTVTLVLLGHDPGVKWPNEDKFLTRTNNYKFNLNVGDLKKELKGIMATRNEDVRKAGQIHWANLQFDQEKSKVVITASHTMRALRKMDIKACEGPATELNFKCVSDYVKDVENNADGDGNVQFEFVDDKAPVLIHYYAGEGISSEPLYRVNVSAGTKEQYTMFFASFNKK